MCEPALVQFRADTKGSAAICTVAKITAGSESFVHYDGVLVNGSLLPVLHGSKVIRKFLYADFGRKWAL